MTYKETAKELGIKYRIWKYGFTFKSGLDNRWRFRIVPLDGWLFGEEMIREMRENGFEL
jgi:hypothetical protein